MNAVEKKRAELYALVRTASEKLYGTCPEFTLVHPNDTRNGDFSASVALALGGILKRPPVETAREIAAEIHVPDGEARMTGKGYVGFFLKPDFLAELLLPPRELPNLPMKPFDDEDFYPFYVYNRLKRLLEHSPRFEGAKPDLLVLPEEVRALWAVAEGTAAELAASAAELYDRVGMTSDFAPLAAARGLLFNNLLYAMYRELRKD